jgi:hypothetical protein
VSVSYEQIVQWLSLLTMNLLVMSSILMEMLMAEGIYTSEEIKQTRKYGKTTTSRNLGSA